MRGISHSHSLIRGPSLLTRAHTALSFLRSLPALSFLSGARPKTRSHGCPISWLLWAVVASVTLAGWGAGVQEDTPLLGFAGCLRCGQTARCVPSTQPSTRLALAAPPATAWLRSACRSPRGTGSRCSPDGGGATPAPGILLHRQPLSSSLLWASTDMDVCLTSWVAISLSFILLLQASQPWPWGAVSWLP